MARDQDTVDGRLTNSKNPSLMGTIEHMEKILSTIEEGLQNTENMMGIDRDTIAKSDRAEQGSLPARAGIVANRMHALNIRLVEIFRAIGG